LEIRSRALRASFSTLVAVPLVFLVGCGSGSGDAGTTTKTGTTGTTRPTVTTVARTTTSARSKTVVAGCRAAPSAVVRHVASGLAFPGPATLADAHVLRAGGAFYLAARIVPPGKRKPVGIGVWTMKTLTRNATVVAVDRTAAAYSDWQRADLPLSAASRSRVVRVRRCLG
jgi:hypothetical protein